jgi:hypothetical protein
MSIYNFKERDSMKNLNFLNIIFRSHCIFLSMASLMLALSANVAYAICTRHADVQAGILWNLRETVGQLTCDQVTTSHLANVGWLVVEHNTQDHVEYKEADFTGLLNLKRLWIKATGGTVKLGMDAFKDITIVENFGIENYTARAIEIQSDTFSSFPNLLKLTYRNEVQILPASLKNLPRVMELGINITSPVSSDFFEGLTHLKKLTITASTDLDGSLPLDILAPLTAVEDIWINESLKKRLSTEHFVGRLPKLRVMRVFEGVCCVASLPTKYRSIYFDLGLESRVRGVGMGTCEKSEIEADSAFLKHITNVESLCALTSGNLNIGPAKYDPHCVVCETQNTMCTEKWAIYSCAR